MAIDRASIIALLRHQHLLQGLDAVQLAQVATRFDPISYNQNGIIFLQGDRGDSFYVVFSGKVSIIHREGRREHRWATLTAGDNFGEEALLFDRPRSATARAIEPSVVLHLSRQHFFDLLDDFPAIRMNLSTTAESRRISHKEKFKWPEETEVIYLICRKHWFFLIRSLAIPILLFLGAIPLLVFGLLQTTGTLPAAAARLASLIMTLVGLGWGLWNWIDWGNDYYVVTNQRVIWLEKVVGIYESSRETPLDAILSVNTISSFWGQLFKYGNVNVRTFTGGISMRNMEKPHVFEDFINRFRQGVSLRSKETELANIEQTLQQEMRKRRQPAEGSRQPAGGSPAASSARATNVASPIATLAGEIRRAWKNLLRMRIEDGNVITYRKHLLILLRKAWLPLLLLSALFAGGVFLLWLHFSEGIPWPSLAAVFGVGSLIAVGVFLWLGYYYWDWRNDIYRLTPEQILDIEKKPLGREEKKTASLENILSIEHERANLLQNLLNFGTVTINVGQTKFIFYHVHNPDQVQQEIADYRTALSRRRQAAEAAREKDRMVKWLMAFYQESSKLEEAESAEAEKSLG